MSRSSALELRRLRSVFRIGENAAKLAARLYLETEPRNDITGSATPASLFEPTIDYAVTKIPAFYRKIPPQADHHLTTQMKSVGEVMVAIGRTFQVNHSKRRCAVWKSV